MKSFNILKDEQDLQDLIIEVLNFPDTDYEIDDTEEDERSIVKFIL